MVIVLVSQSLCVFDTVSLCLCHCRWFSVSVSLPFATVTGDAGETVFPSLSLDLSVSLCLYLSPFRSPHRGWRSSCLVVLQWRWPLSWWLAWSRSRPPPPLPPRKHRGRRRSSRLHFRLIVDDVAQPRAQIRETPFLNAKWGIEGEAEGDRRGQWLRISLTDSMPFEQIRWNWNLQKKWLFL